MRGLIFSQAFGKNEDFSVWFKITRQKKESFPLRGNFIDCGIVSDGDKNLCTDGSTWGSSGNQITINEYDTKESRKQVLYKENILPKNAWEYFENEDACIS